MASSTPSPPANGKETELSKRRRPIPIEAAGSPERGGAGQVQECAQPCKRAHPWPPLAEGKGVRDGNQPCKRLSYTPNVVVYVWGELAYCPLDPVRRGAIRKSYSIAPHYCAYSILLSCHNGRTIAKL